jgi:RNA polymerase sigma-B factor
VVSPAKSLLPCPIRVPSRQQGAEGGHGHGSAADESTRRLLRAYREHGDLRARDRLMELHMPLVRSLARRHAGRGEELEDLMQVGAIGLLQAIERYRPERGEDLAAFAAPTIAGEIKRHLRDRASLVRIPRRLQQQSAALERARGELHERLGRSPSWPELGAALGLDDEEVSATIESVQTRMPLSLSGDPASGSEARGESDPGYERSENRMLLAGAFATLEPSAREAVHARFVRGVPHAQVARELGISERQLARVLARALDALREAIVSTAEPPAGANDLHPRPPAPTIAPMAAGGGADIDGYLARPYRITVTRDDAHPARWVAQVAELPGCTAAGDSPQEAADRITPAMREWIGEALRKRRQVPEPRAASTHSGRLLLRMPQSLHADLAREAELEDVSLNQFITAALASAVAQRRGEEPAAAAAPEPVPEPATRSPLMTRAILVNIVVIALAVGAAVVLLVIGVNGS